MRSAVSGVAGQTQSRSPANEGEHINTICLCGPTSSDGRGRVGLGRFRRANCTRGGQVRLGELNQVVEDLWIIDRKLAEHLAVQQDSRVLQAVDESTVAGSAHAAGRGESGDPKPAKVSSPGPPIAIGELTGPQQGDFRLGLVPVMGAAIAAGGGEYAAPNLGTLSTFANTGHDSIPDSTLRTSPATRRSARPVSFPHNTYCPHNTY